jgi:hypothetical protein
MKIFEDLPFGLQSRINGFDRINRVIRPLDIGRRDVTWLGSTAALD